jgi:hypothetical protein
MTPLKLTILSAALGLASLSYARQPPNHHDAVNQRGDQVMGFSEEKTTHHFRLYADGGSIEVTANDGKDTESRDLIRTHLARIAGMFAAGNFEAPMLIHGPTPPGVPTLQRLKAEITYRYEKLGRGGRVTISTKNAEAVEAIHDFLRFQIFDHMTGDSPAIGPKK